MTDSISQNVTSSYYESLTPGFPETQNNQTPDETLFNNNEKTATYRTPYFYSMGIIILVFFLLGTIGASIMISVGIYNNEILMIIYSIIPLVFAIAASCVGAYGDAYIIINISSTIGTIEIKNNKFLFCYNTQ